MMRPIPPDDRLTAVIAPVRDGAAPASLRDPVEEVKAALDRAPGTPAASAAPTVRAAAIRLARAAGAPGAHRRWWRAATRPDPAQDPGLEWAALAGRGTGRLRRAAAGHLRDGLPDRQRAQAG